MEIFSNFRKLVETKLAACVNIIPGLTSVYEWKGKIETDPEVLLMIKTRTSRVGELSDLVRSLHPYDVCEVISLPVSASLRVIWSFDLTYYRYWMEILLT